MGCMRIEDDGDFLIVCGAITEDFGQCDCGNVAALLCDFPLPGEGRRCDAPLCSRCAKEPQGTIEVHLCAVHEDAGWPFGKKVGA